MIWKNVGKNFHGLNHVFRNYFDLLGFDLNRIKEKENKSCDLGFWI